MQEGGLTVPLPVKTCRAGTHFIFQHISTLATKKKEFTAGQVHNHTMPALSPNSSSPHPDIWFDSGWARFTFYNNNRTWGKVCLPLQAARGVDHCSIRCLFKAFLSLVSYQKCNRRENRNGRVSPEKWLGENRTLTHFNTEAIISVGYLQVETFPNPIFLCLNSGISGSRKARKETRSGCVRGSHFWLPLKNYHI